MTCDGSDEEMNIQFNLSDIPETLTVRHLTYILAGAILFIAPNIEDDDGHYICAVKVNRTWEFYDDMDKRSPLSKPARELVSIHTLMYASN